MNNVAIMIILFEFLMTFGLVYGFRHLAYRFQLLDVPNARSSHTCPTPSAGGIGIVLSFFLGLIILHTLDLCSNQQLYSFFLGGALLAYIGFLDDFKRVSVLIRVICHFVAAGLVLYFLGGMPPLDCGFAIYHWHILGFIVGLLGLVWLINLYNFMDGIDGLAASEAIFVCVAAALLLIIKHSFAFVPLLLLLASTVAGFLLLNWPPARIFMGDTGSGFLGFVLGVMLIITTTIGGLSPWQWLILLGCFWIDATLTLLIRVVTGQPWYLPHCDHAFQHAVKRLGSHQRVLCRIVMINMFWLLPMAILTLYFPTWLLLITAIAIIPLVVLCVFLRAGMNTNSEEGGTIIEDLLAARKRTLTN